MFVIILKKKGKKGYKEYEANIIGYPKNFPIPNKGDQLYLHNHMDIPLVVRKVIYHLQTKVGMIPNIQIICSEHK